ncbi:MAG: flagellar export chaperone FliS, partial [Planctomycetota bacterium]|nr:flagellar export chaperone FliS [Planctomycetota bacterium]
YGRLVEANLQKKVGLLDEALRILRTMRATWAEAIERTQKSQGTRREAAAAPGSGAKGGQISVEG